MLWCWGGCKGAVVLPCSSPSRGLTGRRWLHLHGRPSCTGAGHNKGRPVAGVFEGYCCLRAIVTPYVVAEWERLLAAHPDREFAAYIVRGITSGFRIGVDPSLINGQFRSADSNMQSARDNAQVIDSYLGAECSLNRVIGPLPGDTPGIHVNRFGVIPKANQPGKWRLIVDLSHPTDFSVNDGIPQALCSLRYVTVDSAVHIIRQCGRGPSSKTRSRKCIS